MSEHPIPEVITPDQDAIWRKRLDGATDYSIKLQRLIESLKREDTPYPELHHHKMAIAVKERIARLESENTALKSGLINLCAACEKVQDWSGTRIGAAMDDADAILYPRATPADK